MFLVLALIACGNPPPEATPAGDGGPKLAPPLEMALENATIVDLSHSLAPEIPVHPGGVALGVEALASVAEDGYFAQKYTIGEHTGTHVDAPAHFVEGGATVDLLPVRSLMGPAAVIDVGRAVASDPDYAVTVDDLKVWEDRHGTLGEAHIVLVRTGWGARWATPDQYLNKDADGVLHFPGVSVEASQYLAQKGVRALGIDTLSTDPGQNASFDQHKHFLAQPGAYHIENLSNLEQVPEAGAVVVVAPAAIVGGSGAPARVLAIVPTGGGAPAVPPGGMPGVQPGGMPAGALPGAPGGQPGAVPAGGPSGSP